MYLVLYIFLFKLAIVPFFHSKPDFFLPHHTHRLLFLTEKHTLAEVQHSVYSGILYNLKAGGFLGIFFFHSWLEEVIA